MSVSSTNRRLKKLRGSRLNLLRDWYGKEFAAVEIAAHGTSPVPISRGIQAVMVGLESAETQRLNDLRKMWTTVAGAAFSKMTYPLEWQDGLLVLEVRHSALIRELQPSLELIREAVSRHFPNAECTAVRLTISGGGRRPTDAD